MEWYIVTHPRGDWNVSAASHRDAAIRVFETVESVRYVGAALDVKLDGADTRMTYVLKESGAVEFFEEPIVGLRRTYGGWTTAALIAERDSMRAKRAADEYDADTERNALSMLRDIAHVLSDREMAWEEREKIESTMGVVAECSTCGFDESYRDMDATPDDCPACGTKWVDD